ncbi:MAG: tetratricopeptide repeat protein [Pseudomonadota bacterium]
MIQAIQRVAHTLGLLSVGLGIALLQGCATSEPVVSGQKSFKTPGGEAGYHIMLAELAVQREEYQTAAHSYRKAADLSEDPEVAARAVALAVDAGELDDALASARRWTDLDPENPQAHRYLATVNLRRGSINAATRDLEWILDRVADSRADGYVTLAAMLLEEPVPTAALQSMQRLARGDKNLPEANYAVGLLALRAGEVGLAKEQVGRAVEGRPEWEKAALLYARVLIANGEPEAALTSLGNRVQADSSPATRLEYAVLLAAVGRDDEARDYLEALLIEQPDDVRTLRNAAIMAFRANDLDASERHFTHLIELGQRSYEAVYYLAAIAEERRDYPRAVNLFTKVVNGDNVIAAQVRAARIIMQLGGVERALDHLDLFSEQYPAYEVDMIVVQGELLNEAGDPGRALALYGEALQDYPDSDSLRYARAFMLEGLDHVDEAIEDLRVVVANKPDDAVALNALGYTLADRTDQTREAYKLIKRALELDPNNPAIIDSMGWVQFRRGRLDDSLDYLWRAYNLVQDAEIAAHIGEVLWTLGRVDEARDVFNGVLEADPENAIVTAVMERLGL